MTAINYAEIFAHLLDEPQWSCEGPQTEYDNFTWLDERPQPSKDECDLVAPLVAEEKHRKEIALSRQAAYQAESDPLFFKAQRNQDGVTIADWEAKVLEIQERYPYTS